MNQQPDYGIDAPGLVRIFFLSAAAALGLCALALLARQAFPTIAAVSLLIFVLATVYLLSMGCLMIFWSKVAKIRGRDGILAQILWRGDERVLDVGCGRGLLMMAAAKRLTTGRATGIDLWLAKDQSNNHAEGALRNARLEGVADKIDIQTGDMRALPFADHTFDVVMSHWVVHNLDAAADRDLALKEMVRVLKPGGHIILCDIEHRDAYLARLAALGLDDGRASFDALTDKILGIVSGGSFRPTAIYAHKPLW